MAKSDMGINNFYDINKLQKGWGTIVFPVSISRMIKDQDAKSVFEHLRNFYPAKSSENKLGIDILYSDGLYQWKAEEEKLSRKQLLGFMNDHRNGFVKLLEKNKHEFQIRDAYDFLTWDTISLSTTDFMDKYDRAFKLVKEDEKFLSYLKEDAKKYGREYTQEQENFFIDEIVIYYLISKMRVELNNMHTQNRDTWVLLAYPGKPLKSQIYFHQKNIFGINNTGNSYENCFYDLTDKKLYDFDRLDLETWDYE